MLTASDAIQAYRAVSKYRSQRDQEADVFRHATAALKAARNGGPIQQIRALADNRRLWLMVGDLLHNPANSLPDPLKASILSVGLTVVKEIEEEIPDFDFLISINENITAGLAVRP